MSAPVFLEINTLKKVLGYEKNDIGTLFISLKDPKHDAVKYANKLQSAIKPSIAIISGNSQYKDKVSPVTVLGFKSDSVSRLLLSKNISTIEPSYLVGKDDILMSESLATALGIHKGDNISITYPAKYDKKIGSGDLRISGFFKPTPNLGSNVILSNDKDFYKIFYSEWPADYHVMASSFIPGQGNPLLPVFSSEWNLLPRIKSTGELRKLQNEISQKRLRGTSISIQSMYESASAILNLEIALNMICL
jgi:ABC-type lipoprotein release transport system permease subunit